MLPRCCNNDLAIQKVDGLMEIFQSEWTNGARLHATSLSCGAIGMAGTAASKFEMDCNGPRTIDRNGTLENSTP